MSGSKTYYADPNDHEAVAAALLEKLQNQQAENAMNTKSSPSLFAVMAECGEGVLFDNQEDAAWTLTGIGSGSDGIGVPVIGEDFREAYQGQQFTAYRALLVPMNIAPEMVLVTKKDASAFCQIVSVLGLDEDEETDIVSFVRLLRDKEVELLDFASNMHSWHAQRLAHTRSIQEEIKEGTRVQCGSEGSPDKAIELVGREAVIFQLGMEAGLASFEKLPFTMTRNGDCDEEDADEEL